MPRVIPVFCCTFLSIFFLLSCSVSPPFIPAGPKEFQPRIITRIAIDGVFAPAPAADKIAVEREGLSLITTGDGAEKKLSEAKPQALAWADDGERLAAAFIEEKRSRLVIYNAEGLELRSAMVAGRVTQLDWSPEGELFAFSIVMDSYSFGTNQKASLLCWNGTGSIESISLFDSTLKLRTVDDLGDELYNLARFDLAPLGDEVIFTRLSDPPVIAKSLKVNQKHLSSGAGRLIYELPLESRGGLWFFDNETLLMSDGTKTFQYDPWQDKELQVWPLKGEHLAVAVGENMVYIDGFLYRENEEIAHLQTGQAHFSQDGRSIFIAAQQTLIMYSLPPAEPVEPLAQDKRMRLLQLREFRSRDLLTSEEYLRAREGLLQ